MLIVNLPTSFKHALFCVLVHYSEWGYYRDDRSGNCMLNTEYGPNLDCLTGYVAC